MPQRDAMVTSGEARRVSQGVNIRVRVNQSGGSHVFATVGCNTYVTLCEHGINQVRLGQGLQRVHHPRLGHGLTILQIRRKGRRKHSLRCATWFLGSFV